MIQGNNLHISKKLKFKTISFRQSLPSDQEKNVKYYAGDLTQVENQK